MDYPILVSSPVSKHETLKTQGPYTEYKLGESSWLNLLARKRYSWLLCFECHSSAICVSWGKVKGRKGLWASFGCIATDARKGPELDLLLFMKNNRLSETDVLIFSIILNKRCNKFSRMKAKLLREDVNTLFLNIVFQVILHLLWPRIVFLVTKYMNMASKKLRRAGLPQELCKRLSRHQITTCQVRQI